MSQDPMVSASSIIMIHTVHPHSSSSRSVLSIIQGHLPSCYIKIEGNGGQAPVMACFANCSLWYHFCLFVCLLMIIGRYL